MSIQKEKKRLDRRIDALKKEGRELQSWLANKLHIYDCGCAIMCKISTDFSEKSRRLDGIVLELKRVDYKLPQRLKEDKLLGLRKRFDE